MLTGFAPLAESQVVAKSKLRDPSLREAGSPLFERLSVEATGIGFENRFDHPRRWLELWKQYFNGSIGTGIALGDVNGDGLPDLFAVGKDSPNALYLNRGEFRFEDVTVLAGVAGGDGFGTGAALVDIDNDGDLDLYVCYVAGTNELFINDGSGRFVDEAEAWGLAFRGGSNAPSFADFDRDGDLDLYLQQNYLNDAGHLDGMPDVLFRNEGGRFVDVTAEAGIEGDGQGHTALWWDFDEDGWPDVYVSNDFEPVDKLYRNNRDGSFSDVIRESLGGAPYSAMGVDAGDLNNDGHVDFLVAEMLSRERAYYHQAVGPLSGKLISARRSGVSQYMQNMLSVPVAPGKFVEVSRLAGLHATNWTWAARFADLDNDGLLDAFFANGMTRAFHDGDIAARMTRARSLAERVRIYEKSEPLRERNLAFRNEGALRFSEVGVAWGLDAESVSFAAAFADFDQDGDLDLVTSNWKEELGVFRNNSQDGLRLMLSLQGRASNRMGLGAKVRLRAGSEWQMREMTSMRGYMSVDEPVAHFASKDGASIDELVIEWPSGATQRVVGLEFGNFYVVGEEASASVGGQLAVGAGERPFFRKSGMAISGASWSREDRFAARKGQLLLPFTEDRKGPALAVADLDGDGWPDVVLGGATGQELRILRNEGGKGLEAVEGRVFEANDLAEDSAVLPFDFDGDGDLDLFVASGGVELDLGDEYYADRLYLNGGGMRFEKADWRGSAEATGVAARLEDGRIWLGGGTLTGRYPAVARNRVLDGELRELEHAFAGSERVSGLVAADLDRDGDEEVIELREYAAPLAWKRGANGELEAGPEVFAGVGSGLWRSAALADFNGDGRMDIALGNLGENNKYLVDGDERAVVFAPRNEAVMGKFIEGLTLDGRVFPRESRIFHQVDFPDIARGGQTYAEFAQMAVEEAFGVEVLAGYERWEFEERRSLLLLQNGAGGFEAVALPGLAQAGVAIEMLAEDFDADGDADLIVVLESLSPQPVAMVHAETSFLLLLRNDGAGGFKAELPWESGLVVETGEPRRLAWADLDGDGREELVVAVSEGPLAVFESWTGD